MPSNRTAEHARQVVDRALRGAQIPPPAHRLLINLANSMEAGKSELKGHLSDRNAQIRNLTQELERARELQTDRGLVELYTAGTALISKQADELNHLKGELQRGKNERDRLVPKLAEKDKQIAKVENEKEICREALRRLQGRLEGMESSPDVQAKTRQEFEMLEQRLEDYRKTVDNQKIIKSLSQDNDRLIMALGRHHFNELDLP
jgi:chromosome segregation ATPase